MPIDKIETEFTSYLDKAAVKLGAALEPFVPSALSANSLTLIGLGGDFAAGIAFYFSKDTHGWLWVAIVGIAIHILADSVDGAVARARAQASKLGAFLDQMTDNVAFVALGLGIGLSGLARLEIVVFGIILALMHAILLYNWIIATGRRVFPLYGSTDYEVSIIATALLFIAFPDFAIPLAGYDLNLFELAFAVGATWSLVDFCLSTAKLVAALRDTDYGG